MPRRTDITKILVIGSGPIVIGQAAEHGRRCASRRIVPSTVKFRFIGQMPSHQSTGHCEPVTDVTGVAIPHNDGIVSYFDDKCLKI